MSKKQLPVKKEFEEMTTQELREQLTMSLKEASSKSLEAVGKYMIPKMSGGHTTMHLLNQLGQVIGKKMDITETLNDIKAIAPQDHVEKMLTVQMIATHDMLMECLRRANILLEKQEFQLVNLGHDTLRLADRLARTYAMQMETLSRYRNKGKQKMTVEHVHVNAGGKAIIGNVSSNNENKAE